MMLTNSHAVHMLFIGVLIMVFYVSSAKVTYADYLRRFNAEVLEYKHTRCFYPSNVVLVDDVNELSKRVVLRWYYYAPTKTCRPFYSPRNFTYTIDNENYNLPRTQLECEALCSDYCIVNHADGKIELGVCTSLEMNSTLLAESCKNVLPENHPKQCPHKYSKCCPRDNERLAHYLN